MPYTNGIAQRQGGVVEHSALRAWEEYNGLHSEEIALTISTSCHKS